MKLILNQNDMNQFLENKEVELAEVRKKAGVSDEIANVPGMTGEMLVSLGDNGIKSLDDLGDLANDELIEIVGKDNLSEKLANEIIMSARAHWFEDEVVSQETFKDTEIEENIKTSSVK